MPGLSSEISVMPLRLQTALTLRAVRRRLARDQRAFEVRRLRGVHIQRYLVLRAPAAMQRGCSTLAPLVAISCASS